MEVTRLHNNETRNMPEIQMKDPTIYKLVMNMEQRERRKQ